MLREYQRRSLDDLYDWMRSNDGHPCLVLPTGAGKSHIVATLCKEGLQNWPETRVLMLTHQKELIEQNAAKMREHWPGAPLGIYSASIGKRQLGEPITFAGIQSVREKASALGHIDLCIIDECFVAGTKVSTPSGNVDIDKVRCGDVVVNQCGFGVVEAISCKPALETYIVELSDGRFIECTGNHPFFTSSGWKAARKLEDGTYLFGVEDVSGLWNCVQTLDQAGCDQKSCFGHAREVVAQASLLLSEMCKEVTSNSFDRASPQKNQQAAKGNSSLTYSAWRQRAIAAFASIGSASRFGRWLDGGIVNQDERRPSQRNLSELLQSGHCQSRKNDCNRTGRRLSQQHRKAGKRQQKDGLFSGAWVVSVSRIERESPALVYNLQVSGHPSYFANGIAVHNCHLVSHKDEGGYRNLLNALLAINPALRVIGLTATPYRLGHGLITDKPALFDGLIDPVTIEELVYKGFLTTLRSKVTKARFDLDGVHKRGGEFIESELQAAVDTDDNNAAVVAEIMALGSDRKHWLLFCTGIEHAQHIADLLNERGIAADCVTGTTPKAERERMIGDFKAGRIQALTNAQVLTTGFDFPAIDLIAMLRPTMSPALYVQMAGRGLRVAPGKADCLVLDFAGVVATHGPITAVQPPTKAGKGDGEAPVKVCEFCDELCHPSVKICPACGSEFPAPEPKTYRLHNDDIMGFAPSEMPVTSWRWRKHTSKTSGKDMLEVTYYGALSDPGVKEYLTVTHEGYAGEKAVATLGIIASNAGVALKPSMTLDGVAAILSGGKPPTGITYKRDGKYYRIIGRLWG